MTAARIATDAIDLFNEIAGPAFQGMAESIQQTKRDILIRGFEAIVGRPADSKPLRHLNLAAARFFANLP